MEAPYPHLPLGQEHRSISGYYILEKEVRLPFSGREVLYVVGAGMADTACCGMGGSRYALVPGFILEWRGTKNEEGQPVSRVERISENSLREEISREIRSREVGVVVQFL